MRIEESDFRIRNGREIETSRGMKKVPEGIADIHKFFKTILKTSYSYDEKMQKITLPEKTRELFNKAKSIASERMIKREKGFHVTLFKNEEATRIYILVSADSLKFPKDDVVFKPDPAHESDTLVLHDDHPPAEESKFDI